jgi:hypothetical protein
MKPLTAACCTAGILVLGVLAGGSPERDIFVHVAVTGRAADCDTVLVSAASLMPTSTALGQQRVPAHILSFMRISENWDSPIYLIGLTLSFEDLYGSPIDPQDAISRIYVEVERPAGNLSRLPATGQETTNPSLSGLGPGDFLETAELGVGAEQADFGGAGPYRAAAGTHAIPAPAPDRPLERAPSGRLAVDLSQPALIPASGNLNVNCFVDIAPDATLPGFSVTVGENSVILGKGTAPDPIVIMSHEAPPGTTACAKTTIIPQTLRGSFTNYPNPFAAGRELTTFAFYLRDHAEVRLRLFTGFGRLVKTLDPGTPRPGGRVHEDIHWDGTDERGTRVQNGAYFAVLDVRYSDGAEEQAVRKVAVLR